MQLNYKLKNERNKKAERVNEEWQEDDLNTSRSGDYDVKSFDGLYGGRLSGEKQSS